MSQLISVQESYTIICIDARMTHGYEWLAGRGSFLFFPALMILYVHLSFGRTEKPMDLLLMFAKKCPRVPTIALHLGSFQLPSVSRCGSFHAYFVFPIKENFGCLERIWIHGPRIFSGVFSSRIGTQILSFSFPNPQRTNTCFLWLLAALENTNRLRKKASSMHLFVEIYPRTFAGTSWKFRDP